MKGIYDEHQQQNRVAYVIERMIMLKIGVRNSVKLSYEPIIDKLRDRIRINPGKVKQFRFKIADEPEEIESAYHLVYDQYVRAGYIDDPCTNPMRLSPYHFLPETTTFIGITDGLVAVTITLFQDTELGLPSDAMYQKELDELRNQGRKIVEVGALASAPDYRNGDQTIVMFANRIMHTYASKHLGVDDLVISINPKHESFYKYILLFEKIGELKQHNTYQNAPAIAYKLNLRTAEKQYKEIR